jgi:hypothetical protein
MVVVTLWAIAKSKKKVRSARVTETEKATGPRSIAGLAAGARSLIRYAQGYVWKMSKELGRRDGRVC